MVSVLKAKWETNTWARWTAKRREQGGRRMSKDNHSKGRRPQAREWVNRAAEFGLVRELLKGEPTAGSACRSGVLSGWAVGTLCLEAPMPSARRAEWSRAVKEAAHDEGQASSSGFGWGRESKLVTLDLGKPDSFWLPVLILLSNLLCRQDSSSPQDLLIQLRFQACTTTLNRVSPKYLTSVTSRIFSTGCGSENM